jgi:hypothetical protein
VDRILGMYNLYIKNKIVLAIPVLTFIFLMSAQSANAYYIPPQDIPWRYNSGYNHGWYQAQTDWNSLQFGVYSYGDSECPDSHTTSFCDGYHDGYIDLWNQWIYNYQHGLNLVYPSIQQGQIQQQIQGCFFTGTATGTFTCSQSQQQEQGGQ